MREHPTGWPHRLYIALQINAAMTGLWRFPRSMQRTVFVDGGATLRNSDVCRNRGGGTLGFIGRDGQRVRDVLHEHSRECKAEQLEAFCAGARRCKTCTGFNTILQCGDKKTDCVCNDQVGKCNWHGLTTENARVHGANGKLIAASPPSFARWACKYWSVSPDVFEACQWQWTGSFAVGAHNIEARPKAVYERARAELAAGNSTGGLAGHYMERLWRSIFLCSLGGVTIPYTYQEDQGLFSLRNRIVQSPKTRAAQGLPCISDSKEELKRLTHRPI